MNHAMKTLACLLLCLAALTGRAQSGGEYDLSWSKVANGGVTSTGGQFTLSGTAGQSDACNPLTGGQFSLAGGFWSFLSVVQISGAPVLKIKLLGNSQAVLSWPVSATGFSLEECPNLAAGAWSATLQPIVDTPAEHTVIVPANGVIKVFRLKK